MSNEVSNEPTTNEPNASPEAPPAEVEATEDSPASAYAKYLKANEPEPTEKPKTDEPTDAKAEVNKSTETKAKDEPEEKPQPDKVELQYARAQKDIKRLTGEVLEHKKVRSELETRLANLEKAFAKDPVQAMIDFTGRPVQEVLKKAAEGAYQENVLDKLPPEIREAVEWATRAKRDAEQKAQQQKEAEDRAADFDVLKSFLGEHGDKFNFLDSSDETITWFLDEVYAEHKRTGSIPDLHDLAQRLDASSAKGFEAMALNERSVRKLVENPSIRSLLLKVLGTPSDQQQPRPTSSKATVVAKPITQPEVLSRSDSEPNEEEAQYKAYLAHLARSSA